MPKITLELCKYVNSLLILSKQKTKNKPDKNSKKMKKWKEKGENLEKKME